MNNNDIKYLEMALYNFKYAIENDVDEVYLGYDIIEEEVYDYWIHKDEWYKLLDVLISMASDLEEYEYCIEFKKIKEALF